MPKSEAYANSVLDDYLGSGAPATVYIGIFTDAPDADGTGGTEVVGGSYARKAVTNNAANWPNAAAREKANANAITFVAASADWGAVDSAGVFDAAIGGTPKYFGNLTTPRTVLNGDTFSFAANQFLIREL